MSERVLTAAAQADRDDFEADRGCCSCHVSPPCGYCTHPGNPANQEENEECWEPAPPPAQGLVSYEQLPYGTRFRYPGIPQVFVKLTGDERGLVAKWDGPSVNRVMQGIYSFADSTEACVTGMVELAERAGPDTPDNAMVICPHCTSQFGAIPVDVQTALSEAHQALLEVKHAQEVGANWYTKGSEGLYQQVSMWVRRGMAAIVKVRS